MVEGKVFVDTNVLLYAFDAKEIEKRRVAREWMGWLWERATGRLSWQVLIEFYVNALRAGLKESERQARETVRLYSTWRPLAVGAPLIDRAWYWRDKAQTSYWDSLILAAAEKEECAWLLSEDFQDGRKYGSVVVVNPFRTSFTKQPTA